MLVLDDLGKESSSRWSLKTLFTIVNSRYEGMRPTVITSQYTLGQLRARLASTGKAGDGGCDSLSNRRDVRRRGSLGTEHEGESRGDSGDAS